LDKPHRALTAPAMKLKVEFKQLVQDKISRGQIKVEGDRFCAPYLNN
jgi:hypothetical protein